MNVSIGLLDRSQLSTSTELSKKLDHETVNHLNSKNSNWSIPGLIIKDNHKFYENQFVQLDEMKERVADRLRSTGQYTAAPFKSHTSLFHFSKTSKDENYSQCLLKEHLTFLDNLLSLIQNKLKIHHEDRNGDYRD